MEFRCPACNTSYRVPVRLGQQVRCARCDHVWRIAQSDFVIDDDARDESEMPEAFSSPGLDDDRDTTQAWADQDSGLPGFAERGDDPAGSLDDAPMPDAASPEEDQTTADHDPARHFDALDWPEAEPADRDAGFDTSADGNETAGPSDADAESFDRRLADSWFAETGEQTTGDMAQPDGEPHAAFERIMEGIEEVIAESSGAESSGHDQAEPEAQDPLRALVSEDRARHLGASMQTEQMTAEPEGEASEDPWDGKVVRLTARGGDRRVESRPQHESWLRDGESGSSESGGSVEPMADLIDKIATGRAEPSDFAEPRERVAAHSEPEPTEPEPTERSQDAMSQAHFQALQADLEDAAHGDRQSADSHASDESAGWAALGYQDEAHVQAQRESLAFDPDQDAFDRREEAQPRSGAHADDDERLEVRDDQFAPEQDHDEWHEDEADSWRDEPADIFAVEPRGERQRDDALDVQTDDALLAEYEFGDEEPTEAARDVAEQGRRGAGTLTVAAAWALFLTVMAAAAVSVISFRDQIAEALPASAPAYAAIGFPVGETALTFEDVSYEWTNSSPRTLTLNGQVKNAGREEAALPPLRIIIRDDEGAALMDGRKPLAPAALAPGETHAFSVDIRAPDNRLRSIELSF